MHKNINMIRGDTLAFAVKITFDDSPQSLDSAYFTCKKNYSDDEPVFQKKLDNGIYLADSDEDSLYYTVRIAPQDTKNLEAGQYYYDLQVGANGDVFTILDGVLDIAWDVTRGAVNAESEYQSKTVTPTTSTQVVTPDDGYEALEQVTVNRIPVEYVIPTGTKNITSNGDVSVSGYATAHVAVPSGGITPTGTININTNGTTDVTNYASANVQVPASAVDSGTKSISSNGTHDVIGYASASVSVPNSYTASDEGKVVSNGALVAQTSDSVTQNGTVDTTLINSLTVNVSGGGGFSLTDLIDRSNITGSVTYSGSVTNLPVGAYGGTAITSFSSSVITGNDDGFAFKGCTSLTTVDLPNFAPPGTNRATNMFNGCSALTSINIPKYTRSGGNFLQNCTSLETIVLPSVDYALQGYFANGCTSLKKVDIGPNIGGGLATGNVFSDTGINLLVIRRTEGVVALGNLNNFQNSPMASNGTGGTIYVPSALKSSYQSASNWSQLNVTWEAIEGSTYETHYADGTVIPT